MKIFLDTASVMEIKKWAQTGLVDGVTTNPTLLSREEGNPIQTLQEICQLIAGPVSAEVTEHEEDGMMKQGRFLQRLAPNIVVKVPLTPVGLSVCRQLRQEGIAVNVTLCFSLSQALLAAKAGATYVSPFIGRLDDIGGNSSQLLKDIRSCYREYPSFQTQILAASIRHLTHVSQAIQAGVEVMTVPPAVFAQLYKHPLTDRGIDLFERDWKTVSQNFPNSTP